ncbi:hypothetical protein H0I31_04455 [Tenacibaculum sp. AHE15PA]|uniref:hypothetical protein n=1 Tax=Tenacibaculum TaxID=104267 RepID=UPI001C5026FB|nr:MULTISPECIES: hypothetical protein [Tenacibaculum]QXP72956.1 hypothetical protein H0I30_09715 [Tenacibaculum sp. AHE14PA]QXP76870.1 hypothetical protein H0I31_04455 [Tenacibaculum sp. AHE15PA]
MKSKLNIFIVVLMVIGLLVSCNDSSENMPDELSIQEKIEFLESGEWLSENGDNEPNVMYTFSKGKRFNSYKSEGVWHEGSTTSSANYMAEENLLTMDFYFGNVYTYNVEFSCDNNIIKFFKDDELADTLYKRNSNYKDCLK